VRDVVVTPQHQTVEPVVEPVARRPQRTDHQVIFVGRHLPGALTVHLDSQAGRHRGHLDLVIQCQRQTERIEARSKIGAGRGYPDPQRRDSHH
jgi:hypothetical protein